MKATIIIPFKEDRGWLDQAINSVRSQEGIEQKDIELLLSQGNGNWPQNFNKAFKESTGDYIKYLHEDDMLSSHCLVDSIQEIKKQGADFIHGEAIEIFPTGKRCLWKSPEPFPSLFQLLKKNTIHSTTLMYKREVFEKVGLFNESEAVKSFEEFEFNLRCLKAGMRIGYSQSVLAYYRRHPKQCIRTVNRQQRSLNRQQLINSFNG